MLVFLYQYRLSFFLSSFSFSNPELTRYKSQKSSSPPSSFPPKFLSPLQFFTFSFSPDLTYSNPLTLLSLGSPLSCPASSALPLSLLPSLSFFITMHIYYSSHSMTPDPTTFFQRAYLQAWEKWLTRWVVRALVASIAATQMPIPCVRFPTGKFLAVCRPCDGCVSRFYKRAVYVYAGGHAKAHARDPPAVRTFHITIRFSSRRMSK